MPSAPFIPSLKGGDIKKSLLSPAFAEAASRRQGRGETIFDNRGRKRGDKSGV